MLRMLRSGPVQVSLTPAMTTRTTGSTNRRRRSAKARNRGRSGTQRGGHGYGGLVIWRVAKRGVRGLCEGRYWGCVGARRGNSAVKRGEKAAAVLVERGDRACV